MNAFELRGDEFPLARQGNERERERDSCGVQSRVNDGIVPVHPRLHVYKLSNLAGESVPGPLFVPADRSTKKRWTTPAFLDRSVFFFFFFFPSVPFAASKKVSRRIGVFEASEG